MLDFQILLISLRALQASAFLAAMSFVDSSTQVPMIFSHLFFSKISLSVSWADVEETMDMNNKFTHKMESIFEVFMAIALGD